MSERPKKRPTVLTRLRIDEVSMVDHGAGQGCKVVISKRDDSAEDHTPLTDAERDRAEYEGRSAIRDQEDIERRAKRDRDDQLFGHFLGIFKGTNKSFAADAAGDEADREDEATPVDELDGPPPPPDGAVQGVPDKTITFDVGDKTITARDERALARWLAVQERIHKSTEESNSMDYTQKLRDLAKRAGPIAIAKVIVDDDNAYGLSEHELTDLVTECAKREHPQLTDAQAFVKMFTDQSEAGVMLRKAFNVVKAEASADSVTSYPFPKF